MKDIKVSVLIANYNNEKYLNECIDSIKKQTYQNIEIVIFLYLLILLMELSDDESS